MEIRSGKESGRAYAGQALIQVVFEGAEPLPDFAEWFASGEVTGKIGECTVIHRPAGFQAARVLLAGAGKQEKFSAPVLRRLVGTAVRILKAKGLTNCAIELAEPFISQDYAAAAVEGALAGNYEGGRLKSDKAGSKFLSEFTVLGQATLEPAIQRGRILGEAQNWARDLANEPPNLMTPTVLAQRAEEMAAKYGLACEIFDEPKMRELGMGALLGVAMGSAEPPRFIILRYRPEGGVAAGSAHLGLVGKGVTFDTGGISIKPADNMDKMKYDMCGSTAVLGAMQAIAQLKPAIAVTAIVPTVENMPGSRAQRPGDIVTTLSGKTVEVLNTDAEGRLILADALTYAQRIGCTHLVDAATLTGACVVALGVVNTGTFSNNDAFCAQWMEAAAEEGEKMWRLPLDDEYKELLKSPFADLHNIGGRSGGAITAALFLKEFADPLPWIHLDIAGTAYVEENKPFLAKGPTAIPLLSFVRLATQLR
jgi:leucyl aminopeptidase